MKWNACTYLVKTQLLPLVIKYITVAAPMDGALVERHDVLGEGASLVREDVLYLAKLLVQRGRPRLGWGVVG